MSRITRTWARRGESKLLVPFLTVGFPTVQQSRELAEVAIDSGADMLELGMPFSDPLADGPDIQLSSQVALQNGVTLIHSLRATEYVRRQSDVPVILMGYFNPLLAYGVTRFVRDAAQAGVDGFIIPDLTVEEADEFTDAMKTAGLSAIFLVAPTSSPKRVKLIAKRSTDFVYAVTVTGVTGAGHQFDAATDGYLRQLRKQLKKPFVAGFGVSDGEKARRLCQYADGVVVGSAIVRQISQGTGSCKRNLGHIGRFLMEIRAAIDRPESAKFDVAKRR